ncbi:MFS transporter [Paenibacillus chitinolyticus]
MSTAVQKTTGDKIMRVLAFTLVISVMNASIFNIVLPQISAEFHLNSAQVSWVASIYMLVYAIGSVIYGKLADKYPLKRLITFGLIIFALGSVIGLSATAYWMVILARGFQAVGSSVIPAAAMIIPIRFFPPETRGRALGISAIGMALGNALGPVLSGLIMSVADWRWLFCLSLLTLVTLPFYRKLLDDKPGTAGKIDAWGGALLAGTVSLLLLSITNGGWITVISGIVLLGLFILRILKAEEPFIQPRLFLNKHYVTGLVVSLIIVGLGFSLSFLIPQLMSHVNHIEPGMIGFMMVPGAAASAMMGLRGGRLADEKGNSFLVYLASALLFISFVLLSSLSGTLPALVSALLIFGNVGMTFMQIALSNTISRSLARDQVGVGMGLMAMMNFIGIASSSAIYSKLLDNGATVTWNPFNLYQGASVYSNIYLGLAVLVLAAAGIYFYRFGRAPEAAGTTPRKAEA